jgi:hypothetical protein
MAYVGLAAGVLYSIGGAIYDVTMTGSMNLGTLLAFLALVGMPIAFAVVGAILGVVEAIVFNLIGKRLGGIEIDFVLQNPDRRRKD